MSPTWVSWSCRWCAGRISATGPNQEVLCVLFPTTKETEHTHGVAPPPRTGQGATMQPASDPRASGAQPAHRQKSRVLLVEDEADLVSSLSYSLQAAGYQVSSALDGATALRLAT